ncbi:hypothetical protein EX30DRAFT_116675 [Ascodesmis nigricans]|uniref:KASH domain-containing protein n=1 Tax=Ascodesmis nigricans TaxID=341454 RepID=A0A4S2MPJ3_9PEZI|nr:hypothetical protein EX30DRAFT_116675 [Ascodesmis nigricans]
MYYSKDLSEIPAHTYTPLRLPNLLLLLLLLLLLTDPSFPKCPLELTTFRHPSCLAKSRFPSFCTTLHPISRLSTLSLPPAPPIGLGCPWTRSHRFSVSRIHISTSFETKEPWL